jgi:hypothetical protein
MYIDKKTDIMEFHNKEKRRKDRKEGFMEKEAYLRVKRWS